MRIDIGHLSFSKKGDALAHFRAILNKHAIGTRLTGSDDADLRALLARHPEVEAKIGAGVASFFISRAQPKGRCFYLERVDRTMTDFSFIICVNGQRRPIAQRIASACRHAVIDQVYAFRDAYAAANADSSGCVPCATTGTMASLSDMHVDHAPPWSFIAIVDAWMASGVVVDVDVHLEATDDGKMGERFIDKALSGSFSSFHRERARLRVVLATENLRFPRASRP